jgi:hypothetical protein
MSHARAACPSNDEGTSPIGALPSCGCYKCELAGRKLTLSRLFTPLAPRSFGYRLNMRRGSMCWPRHCATAPSANLVGEKRTSGTSSRLRGEPPMSKREEKEQEQAPVLSLRDPIQHSHPSPRADTSTVNRSGLVRHRCRPSQHGSDRCLRSSQCPGTPPLVRPAVVSERQSVEAQDLR